jgi:hypothetical protein
MPLDLSILESVGIGGVAVVALYFSFQVFRIFIAQWRSSTDSIDKNTEAFQKLSDVFEKQSQREQEFQDHALKLLNENKTTSEDTNKKVTDIHKKFIP